MFDPNGDQVGKVRDFVVSLLTGDKPPRVLGLLVEGMNRDGGLLQAFDYAKRQVSRRETMEGFKPSEPQLSVGEAILPRLRAWEATLAPAPRLQYPYDP